jgi:hypothetical protein
MILHVKRLLVVVLAGALVAACGSSSTPTSASVTPASLALAGNASFTDFGQTAQMVATVTLSNGAVQDQTLATAWSSSNVAVARVSATGLVTATGSGAATIAATFQGLSASRAVTVTIACQINDSATFTFGNRSTTAQDVVWDGAFLYTLAPGQDGTPVVARVGSHTLAFLIARSTTAACSERPVIGVQCTNQLITCPDDVH